MKAPYLDKKHCCGCTACLNICPKSIISMREDEEGFLYPHINEDLCVNCGLCKKVCDFQKREHLIEKPDYPLVYAAKIKDETVRLSSTSGGAFTAFSDWILDNNGIVFGVKFDENLTAITSYAETVEERDKFRGSKYMQSELGNSFNEVRNFLKQDKIVMFSGTPCQTAALQNYCKDIDTKNLYLCDLVCHGVPPQSLFKECVKFLEKKIGKKITEYYCRYKSNDVNWSHTEAQVDKDGNYYYYYYRDIYYSHNALRPSCYNCKYTNFDRRSDITIADYWGIENFMPDFYDNKGVSLIIINSDKGRNWLNNIKNQFDLRESNKQDCSFKNGHLMAPPISPREREKFWIDYKTKGFAFLAKKYGNDNLKYKTKNCLKIILIKLKLFDMLKKLRKDKLR